VKVKVLLVSCLMAVAFGQSSQTRQRIDVQDYAIDAQIDPTAQTIQATALVRFIPVDDASGVTFELNNALDLKQVTDDQGRQLPASRLQQDNSVRVTFSQPLPKGKASTMIFTYGGKLTGQEESPVFGIKFAAITPDVTYLMYPARWFPVNDYTADRFTMDLKITTPTGYRVLASGIDSIDQAPAGAQSTHYKFDQASFPGSLAIVRGEPKNISAGGVTTAVYFRKSGDMAGAYGEEFGKAMTELTGVFGLPPKRNLAVVETETGAPNGYSAPGLIFLSPGGIGSQVNLRLVANNVARQWWGTLVSPATRNHAWIENGMARYAEFLYLERSNGGASAADNAIRDTYVEAMTVEQPPLAQAARLEDYSPEFWAATAGKGAAVLHMLRGVIGDEAFMKVLKTVPERYAWKQINTDQFQKIVEEAAGGQSLNYFFRQWIDSTGAPEFKMEYTIFRTQKGFRVMGKISQDLDTFRMPVTLKIETEGNPESKTVEVVGTSSEFSVDTFGKPKTVTLDSKGQVLRMDDQTRVAVAIRKGEQFVEIGETSEALKEYQKALEVRRNNSLAHYRIGDLFFQQGNNQSAANEFRESLNGDLEPKWTEVWAHINLGKIFDLTDQRDRAVNEYRQALRTKDNTYGALEEAQKYINAKYERKRASN
jgi:tetratricopeptide (TPR) repeat protein